MRTTKYFSLHFLSAFLLWVASATLSVGTALAAPPPWANGNTNVLFIMVQFPADAADPDGAQSAVNCSFTAAQAQANLFGATATGPGNMTDYYNEVSFGALNLNGTVVGCFTVANDKDDYDDGPLTPANLVSEAIALADASVDFSAFDNDGDGEVDNVAIIYAGNGPDNGVYTGLDPNVNRLWPHASNIGAVAVDDGARVVREYFIAPELLNSTPALRTIGVYAHELGHKLGLPDLYDTDNSSEGIGHWGLMGSGSWNSNTPGVENGEAPAHMGAWSKYFLGWITPTDLTGVNQDLNISQAATNPSAVRLLSNPGGPDDWKGGTGEYFLLENRQQTGFDVGLDGCGILVWHIDESINSNANEGYTIGSHRLVDLEEADPAPEELDTVGINRGDAGDPFPGSSNNQQFSDSTAPSSQLYDGSNPGIEVNFVSGSCADPMLVRFGPNSAPIADAGGPYIAECQGVTTNVALNGSSSFDPDGDPLSYSWMNSCPGGSFNDATDDQPVLTVDTAPLVSEINCNVSLTVEDPLMSMDSDSTSLSIDDTIAPNLTVPADVTAECTGPGGTVVDIGTAIAIDICDSSVVISNNAPVVFPLGDTIVTWLAEDDRGNQTSVAQTVTVEDTIPPEISIALNPNMLWPPNHKMHTINASVTVSDVCDPNPTVSVSSVASNEPDNGSGDGDTINDIQDLQVGTDDREFRLRAERSGNGQGRIYTATYEAEDASGNSASALDAVTVPKSQ